MLTNMPGDIYKRVLDNSMDALFLHRLDGRFLDVNKRACESLGYTREDMLGMGIKDVSVNFRPDSINSVLEQAKTHGCMTIDDTHRRKDGTTFPVEVVVGILGSGPETVLFSLARDASSRKQAMEVARAHEERFRIFFQSIEDAIFVHPLQKQGFAPFIEVNEVACDRYGYSRDELLRLTAADITQKPDANQHGAHENRERLREAGHLVFETVHIKKSGQAFPVEINANIVGQSGNRVIIAVVRDISERKLAEEKLIESEARNAAILRVIPDMMFQIDRDGRLLSYSATSENSLYRSPEEFLGHTLDEIFPPDVTRVTRRHIDRALDDNDLQVFTYRLPLQGEERIYEARLAVLSTDRVLAIVRDITEQNETMLALEQERRRLGDILIGTNAGTWDWNVLTGEVVLNERWAQIMGKSIQDLSPLSIQTWIDNVHPDDLPHANASLDAHFSGRDDYYDVEFRQPHKDGRWVWVNARGKVVEWTEDGQPLRMRGTHLDITERKIVEAEKLDLERQMQHAQKLESLGVLAGGIAHDFNNILMGVLGNAELAKMQLAPESPVLDYVNSIESAATRAADLAKQMLAYSGKGRFVVGPINLCRMVQEMTHLLSTSISKTAVLKFDLPDNISLVEADVTQVRQVFMNLITNASEAMGENPGVITVTAGTMEVSNDYLAQTLAGNNVVEGWFSYIEVSDTGCGMDRSTQERMFDPFFTTKLTGRGLGMAATLGIVRGHGGAIRISSETGKGSTIKVLFPCCAGSANDVREQEGTHSLGPWSGCGAILVVDDEPAVREVAKKTLEAYGLSVLLAEDGLIGLKVLEDHRDRIDLVLLDMTMPNMGGEEAFRRMRELQPGVKVILSSGYNEQEATNRFAGKGLAGFLQKPYRPSELVSKIRSFFGESPRDSLPG